MADAASSPEEVTLTALANSLGIQAPSLYNHIQNLDDLHHAMAVFGIKDLLNRIQLATVGRAGREAIFSMAVAYRQFAFDHPGVYPLTLRAPEPDDETLNTLAQELLKTILIVLTSYGVEGDYAIHAVRGIRSLLHGFVSLEDAGGFRMPIDLDDSFHHLINTYLDGLECSPHIVK